ncbi:MAG: ZIP family metal transporter [Candidatus Moraniibacteriota bacterium]
MASIYLYTFLSVLAVSLISLVGIFTFFWRVTDLERWIGFLISLAAGALLGDAFIHLIPEAFEEATEPTTISLLIIVGIVLFFLLEKALHWHHHGEDADASGIHPVGKLVLLSDVFHNLLDGIIIAAAFMASVPVGIATTFAVILHEIPQEIGDFAVLIYSGFTRKRALFVNFLTALSAFAGALIFFLLASLRKQQRPFLFPLWPVVSSISPCPILFRNCSVLGMQANPLPNFWRW